MASILQVNEVAPPFRIKSPGEPLADRVGVGIHSPTVGRSTNSCFSSELRSWIDNCIVPILVKEYFAKLETEKNIDLAPEAVTKFGGEVDPLTEVRN